MPDPPKIWTFQLLIHGLVQGVGFRPYLYRSAQAHQLDGWVENRNDGVCVVFNASREGAERFAYEVKLQAPEACEIAAMHLEKISFRELKPFHIRKSRDLSREVTGISPDIAVCQQCLDDMLKQPHRLFYPFINCTHCGPRFSIISRLPYDRKHTSMEAFEMCSLCRKEYEDVRDRRFHAQPVACNHCGPAYSLNGKAVTASDIKEWVSFLAKEIESGKVFALKGTGGYHLLCDAFHPDAVARLREMKIRDQKPFALMFESLEAAREYVEINPQEEKLLTSWQRPIVLLEKRGSFTPGVADGLASLGIMLPYLPLHFLLFSALNTKALVLTSANISDEPILIDDEKTSQVFGKKSAGIISYNREIINRCDDSLSMVIGKSPLILRRSRGFVPKPMKTFLNTEGTFAAGAELVNSFALGKGNQAYLSQYIGDLKNLETYDFYQNALDRFSEMFRFTPRVVAHDQHPDYLSTRFAKSYAEAMGGIPRLEVQHHHAHLASVMLEKQLQGEVIGFSYDGLGLGDDGRFWGAEAMILGYGAYQRAFHFEYLPLPGGDRANKEPWRMAVAYLRQYFGEAWRDLPLPLFQHIPSERLDRLDQMLEQRINTPLISSTGRLFDALAALLGISYYNGYQAEAALKLEALATRHVEESYPYEIRSGVLSFGPMIRAVVEDILKGRSKTGISARFHNTLVDATVELAGQLRAETKIKQVVLSGGSFQNRNLSGKLLQRLESKGFDVFLPAYVPVNDQGIALGQLAIAAFRMREEGIR